MLTTCPGQVPGQLQEPQSWHLARSERRNSAERLPPYKLYTAGQRISGHADTIPPHMLGSILAAMHKALLLACMLTVLLLVLEVTVLGKRAADPCPGTSQGFLRKLELDQSKQRRM